jgi:hypothetical protein
MWHWRDAIAGKELDGLPRPLYIDCGIFHQRKYTFTT